MDLTKLSHNELQALKADIEQETQNRKKHQRKEVIAQLRVVPKEAGFTLEELVGDSKGKTRMPAKVKYRDPKNPSNTWAGRGRKPKWLEAAEKKGKKIEDFAV